MYRRNSSTQLQGISKGGFAIIWSIEKETFYVYKDLDLSYTYVLCSNPSKYSSNTLAYLSSFFYDSFGAPTSSNPPFSYECSYEYNKWNFSTGRIVTGLSITPESAKALATASATA